MSGRIFVARQRGGFCNNLKCYLSSMRYARRGDLQLVTDCSDLAEVYENMTLVSGSDLPNDAEGLSDWRLHLFDDDMLQSGFSKSTLARGYEGARKDGRNIDFEFERIPVEMQRIYGDLLNSLRVRPVIKEFVDTFANTHFTEDTISIHMRSWMTDSWDKAPKRHAHFFRYSAYAEVIRSSPTSRVFLASDNADYAATVREEFGDRIITVDPGDKMSPVEFAFVELLLLSKNSRLYGSRASTFTEMAWWYSGCRSQVTLL